LKKSPRSSWAFIYVFNLQQRAIRRRPGILAITQGANVTGYSDTGLSAGTTYYYRARSYNAAGNSSYSSEASVTTLPAASPNDAAFVSQSVATSMIAGQTYSVSVTFLNTGTTTWSGGSGYKLASQNPFNNSTWGTTRVVLPPGSRPVWPSHFSIPPNNMGNKNARHSTILLTEKLAVVVSLQQDAKFSWQLSNEQS
jgi:hypothetical protein